MSFPDRLRLPFTFDAERLAEDLRRLAMDEWIRHFVTQNYDGDWSVVPLRGPAGATHPVMMIYSDPACKSFADTPLLAACPYFRHVLSTFKCPLHAVRLMRLGPGSIIKEHTDHDLCFEEGMARIHIPVVTNDGVEFYLNGSRVALAVGEAWYLRLSDPHRVANNGATARVHMVIDAVVNVWIAGVFEEAARASASGVPTQASTTRGSALHDGDLDRFCELVLHDGETQRDLYAIDDPERFVQAAQALATRHGLSLDRAAVLERMHDNQERFIARRRVR